MGFALPLYLINISNIDIVQISISLYSHNLLSQLCICVLLLLQIVGYGLDNHLTYLESLKIIILIVSFMALLYLDIRRINNTLPVEVYISAISEAACYSLLIIPLAAIGISVCFLILITFLEKVGADPEHSAFMNDAVFYGTMYGPFYVIYWNAKSRLLSHSMLPS